MNIDVLHSALVSLAALSEEIRSRREHVSAGDAPFALRGFLDATERDLRIVKARLARELGFPMCRCCWPRELLIPEPKGRVYSPALPKTAAARNIANRRASSAGATMRNSFKPLGVDGLTRAEKDKLRTLQDPMVESTASVGKSKLRPRGSGGGAPAFGGDDADAGNDAALRDFALSLLSQIEMVW